MAHSTRRWQDIALLHADPEHIMEQIERDLEDSVTYTVSLISSTVGTMMCCNNNDVAPLLF